MAIFILKIQTICKLGNSPPSYCKIADRDFSDKQGCSTNSHFSSNADKTRSLHHLMEKSRCPSAKPSSDLHPRSTSDLAEKLPGQNPASEWMKNVYNETIQDIRDVCGELRSFINSDASDKKSCPKDAYDEVLLGFYSKLGGKQARLSMLWDECRGDDGDYDNVPSLIPEVKEMQEVYAFLLRSLFGNVRHG